MGEAVLKNETNCDQRTDPRNGVWMVKGLPCEDAEPCRVPPRNDVSTSPQF